MGPCRFEPVEDWVSYSSGSACLCDFILPLQIRPNVTIQTRSVEDLLYKIVARNVDNSSLRS